MTHKKITLFGISIDALKLEDLIEIIEDTIQNRQKVYAASLDAATVVNMLRNPESFKAITSADILTADGYYVVLASMLLGKALPGQVFGVEIQKSCVELAFQKGYKIFFLGAKQAVGERMIQFYSEQYSPKIIAGYQHGYFSIQEEEKIVQQINQSGAQILLLGISSPLKELFLSRNKNKLNVNFLSGVGGVFDIIGGKTKRAPSWIISVKLEWFYRFLLEPKRMWKRVFVLYPLFVFYTFRELFKKQS